MGFPPSLSLRSICKKNAGLHTLYPERPMFWHHRGCEKQIQHHSSSGSAQHQKEKTTGILCLLASHCVSGWEALSFIYRTSQQICLHPEVRFDGSIAILAYYN